jgi:hypothetical protein
MCMVIETKPIRLVKTPRILRRGLREVQFGGVLQHEHHRVFVDPSQRGGVMWLQKGFGRDGVIVKQTIRGERVSSLVKGRVHAASRIDMQSFQNLLAALIQAFVSQINSSKFIHDSSRNDNAPCRNGR